MKIQNKKVLLTGGAGFLGSQIVENLYDKNEIVIYSRDEAKHYFLKKRFPKIKCIIGDVYNGSRLNDAAKGCDIGIFLAALKQIEAVEENIEEGINTIVYGAINSKKAALVNDFEASCVISSDKSASPVLSYGAAKLISENVFVNNNERIEGKFTACRYGNVLNSKGSILPLIYQAIEHNYILTLYSEEMTRFSITSEDAIDLIFKALDYRDSVIIPKLRAFKILDLFEIFRKRNGLMYKIGDPRPNEKIHESLFGVDESRRIRYNRDDNIFVLGQGNSYSEYNNVNYASNDYCMSKDELEQQLTDNNFYESGK